MKRVCWLVGILVMLSGCAPEDRALAQAMAFRETLLSKQGCAFAVKVTADYGDTLNQFSMDCRSDAQGELFFTMTEPQSLSGISGSLGAAGGAIRFEEDALYFPLLTDELLTPASAPWIFLKALRSGQLRTVCLEEQLLHITADDTYEEDALTVDIWLNEETVPVKADILQEGKRILSLDVEGFVFL